MKYSRFDHFLSFVMFLSSLQATCNFVLVPFVHLEKKKKQMLNYIIKYQHQDPNPHITYKFT